MCVKIIVFVAIMAVITLITALPTEEETALDEGRKRKGGGMMSSMIPMMVIPFLVSAAMVPMSLISLKMMLIQSMFVGKIAILLMIISMFRNRNSNQEGGVLNYNLAERNEKDKGMKIQMEHYGYSGGEEYGAYVNKRRRRGR